MSEDHFGDPLQRRESAGLDAPAPVIEERPGADTSQPSREGSKASFL